LVFRSWLAGQALYISCPTAHHVEKFRTASHVSSLVSTSALSYLRPHYRKKDLCRVLSILPSIFFGRSAKNEIFAECPLPGFCRVSQTLGKAPESGSARSCMQAIFLLSSSERLVPTKWQNNRIN
jgi:hypothetical protein